MSKPNEGKKCDQPLPGIPRLRMAISLTLWVLLVVFASAWIPVLLGFRDSKALGECPVILDLLRTLVLFFAGATVLLGAIPLEVRPRADFWVQLISSILGRLFLLLVAVSYVVEGILATAGCETRPPWTYVAVIGAIIGLIALISGYLVWLLDGYLRYRRQRGGR